MRSSLDRTVNKHTVAITIMRNKPLSAASFGNGANGWRANDGIGLDAKNSLLQQWSPQSQLIPAGKSTRRTSKMKYRLTCSALFYRLVSLSRVRVLCSSFLEYCAPTVPIKWWLSCRRRACGTCARVHVQICINKHRISLWLSSYN